MEWPALTPLRFRDVGHRLQVTSEVVPLSLLALEVIDRVCVSGSSI